MGIEKILAWVALVVAGLVCLIFLLDLAGGIFGRIIVLDVLFIIGGGLVIWQGVETVRELR